MTVPNDPNFNKMLQTPVKATDVAPNGVDKPKFEGEVFELRESYEKDRHHSVVITQDGRTKQYVCVLGTFNGVGYSLPEALHQLANNMDASGVYGAEKPDGKFFHRRNKLRVCRYCDGTIFFAKTQNDKWLPVDGDDIDAKDLSDEKYGDRCFTLNDIGRETQVRNLSRPGGRVWIAHPDVCGANATEPKNPLLKERWDRNRSRMAEHNVEAQAGLQKILDDLS